MHPTARDAADPDAWVPSIWPEDLEYTVKKWVELTVAKKAIHFEYRSNKPWEAAHGRAGSATAYTWILCTATPELSDTGELLYCTGVCTEINEQKWIQGDSLRRAKEADDAKRQQVSVFRKY